MQMVLPAAIPFWIMTFPFFAISCNKFFFFDNVKFEKNSGTGFKKTQFVVYNAVNRSFNKGPHNNLSSIFNNFTLNWQNINER